MNCIVHCNYFIFHTFHFILFAQELVILIILCFVFFISGYFIFNCSRIVYFNYFTFNYKSFILIILYLCFLTFSQNLNVTIETR